MASAACIPWTSSGEVSSLTRITFSPFTFQDWADAFEHLRRHIKPSDIVLFDEISWMGSKDPSFIPKLKAWWDKQPFPIMVVFCGSVSTWIEENILKKLFLE